MKTKPDGSISVFFALCYLLVLLTILGLTESARLKAEGVCLQLAVSGASDALFGNYCKELYEEYGLLFFDGGYGSDSLKPERISQEWCSYLQEYERGPEGLGLFPFTLSEGSLTDLETVVDRNGEALIEEIYEYEKYEGAMDLYDRTFQVINTFKQPTVNTGGINITGLLTGENVVELPGSSNELPEVSIPLIGDTDTKSDLLPSVTGKAKGKMKSRISSRSSTQYSCDEYTMRDLFMVLNTGTVLMMGVDPFYWKINDRNIKIENSPAVYAPGGLSFEGLTGMENFLEQSRSYGNTEEEYKRLFFLTYSMKHFRSYSDVGSNAKAVETSSGDVLPAFEVEYILFGYSNDRLNYIASVETLAAIRGMCNVISLLADADKMKKIMEFAEEIASEGTPIAVAAVAAQIVILWSITETIVDIRALLRNEKVSVFKTHETWKTDLTDLPDLITTLTLDGWKGLKESLFGEKAAMLTDSGNAGTELALPGDLSSGVAVSDSSILSLTGDALEDPDIIDVPEGSWQVVGSEEIPEGKATLPDIRLNYEEYLFLAGMFLDLSSMAYRMMAVMQGHVADKAPGFRMEHMTYSMSFEAEVTMNPVFLPASESRKRFKIYSRKIRLSDLRTY